MNTVTFNEYLRVRCPRNPVEAEFLTGVLADPSFPAMDSWIDVAHYLDRTDASDDAADAARSLWLTFLRI